MTDNIYDTQVERVRSLSPRVIEVTLRFKNKQFHFKAGQAVQAFLQANGEMRHGFYSIASAPDSNDILELCVTLGKEGSFSHLMRSLKTGDHVEIRGPLGRFVLPDSIAADAVFLAAGSGIAPFRSMIKHLIRQAFQHRIYLIFGNRMEADILYRAEWEKLDRENTSFFYVPTLSQAGAGWTAARGYVQEVMDSVLSSFEDKDFFVCGPKPMVQATNEKLTTRGVPSDQIYFERY